MFSHPFVGPLVSLECGAHVADIAVLGAHVVRWEHEGKNMLWCASQRLEGKPYRGGIPVCWPWFGPHPTDAIQPAHGTARRREWNVVDVGASQACFRLQEGDVEAVYSIKLTMEGLELVLTTTNQGSTPHTVSAALHTYLAVDNVAKVRIEGLEGTHYIDQLDNDTMKPQHGPVTFAGEVDRVYQAGKAIVREGTRGVMVDSLGASASTVVWNPWVEKSARLGDMTAEDYRHMVCVETAWAMNDARVIKPKQQATLKAVLTPISV
ncbi:MAG: D-hexose-6-phosphate mutarotase [Alphaproteobacteria bacterium]